MNKDRVIYKVFPENRVVVAEIHDCGWDAQKVINTLADNVSASLFVAADRFDERFIMNYCYKATARCHPDDEFDVEVGKKIALRKLTEIYHRSLYKHVDNYMKYLSTAAENVQAYLNRKHYDGTKKAKK